LTKEQRVVWARLARRFGGPVYPIYRRGLATGAPTLVSVYLGGRGFKLVQGWDWDSRSLVPGSESWDLEFPGGVQ
jgi:hypothetical protein